MIGWCCLYYCVWNSLLALLEALFARKLLPMESCHNNMTQRIPYCAWFKVIKYQIGYFVTILVCVFLRAISQMCLGILGTIKDSRENAWKCPMRKLFAVPWTDVILVHFFGYQLGCLFMSSFDLSVVVVLALIMCILCSRYTFKAAKIKWKMWTWASKSFGLLWENAGDIKPTEAWRESETIDLARALQEKKTFTELEGGVFLHQTSVHG